VGWRPIWDSSLFSLHYASAAALLLTLFLIGRRSGAQAVLVLGLDGVARAAERSHDQEWLGAGAAPSSANSRLSG
jgi:hypothetical protein